MDNYGTAFQSSYSPDLYTPPSAYEWQDLTAAAGPKPLAWKLAGPPPATSVQKGNSIASRRAEAPYSPPAQPGALAASRPAAQAPSKPFAAAATAAVFATSVLPERSAPSAVLGSGIAGYTSVVTRTPISPSGYSVPIQPKHMPAQQQPQQQQQTSTHGTIRTYGDPKLLSSSYGQPGEYGQVATGSSGSYMASGTPASAAAAALAALAGSHSRSSSAPSAGYAQQYASKNYAAQPAPASPTSGAKGSMLMWNVKQLPPQPGSAAGQRSGAGAGAFGTTRLISTAPNTSSSSGRPPSQEAGSAGLAKLKQLSTARLVRRLGTPPGAAGQQDSTTDPGYFGSRPAAPAAAAGLGSTPPSNPIAGRRAAAVQPTQRQQQQQDTVQLQQMQQRQAQVQQMQNARQQPAQQSARHEAANLGRPTELSLNRRRTSSSSNSSSHRGPAGAAVQDTHTNTFSSSGSTRSVQRAPSSRAQGMAGTGAFQHTAQAQLPAGAEYQEVDRQPCASCGRCFAPAALQQHMRICDKVFGQKRKAFDIKAQRLQGTGAAAAAGRARGNSGGGSRPGQQQQRGVNHDRRPAVSTAQAKKSKWQLQSEQLRAAMRATRPQAAGAAGGWGGAAQVEELEDTRVQCPHCGRRFAELVAERHIPKCIDIIAKPSRLKAAGGRAAYMRVNSGGR